MTQPAAMTYDSLVSDIQNYAERTNDSVFTAQVPRFIMNAEVRLSTEAHGLGFVNVVSGSFSSANPVLAKPEQWRETKSFLFIDSTSGNKVKFLKNRSYEYCKSFWPVAASTGVPRFYADYDYEHFYVVPTPSSGFALELSYYQRPTPLSSTNQTNWTTQYAPNLLLYACLLETAPFVKNPELLQTWQAMYDRALAALAGEGVARMQDQAETRK